MSLRIRSAWYFGARTLDEVWAKFDSFIVSVWLLAVTGRWPRGLRVDGLPRVRLHASAQLHVGDGVRLISSYGLNAVGGSERVVIWVGKAGRVSIGHRSGLSHATVVCLESIEIGNQVLVGGGARIFDSDFHSLGPKLTPGQDLPIARPVKIEDDVFVGAYATILKGVTLGRGCVIGAASVVTKDVPPYEVWAGNPARMIGAVGPKKLANQGDCL